MSSCIFSIIFLVFILPGFSRILLWRHWVIRKIHRTNLGREEDLQLESSHRKVICWKGRESEGKRRWGGRGEGKSKNYLFEIWRFLMVKMLAEFACSAPVSVGNICSTGIQRSAWYYDSARSTCTQFTYLGKNFSYYPIKFIEFFIFEFFFSLIN